MRSVRLLPFEEDEISKVFELSASLSKQTDHTVKVEFLLKGPLDQLKIPAPLPNPKRRPGLWQSTCFEVFMKDQSSEKYEEWNFSLSGEWWNQSFDRYRKSAIEQPEKQAKSIELKRDSEHLKLDLVLPLAFKKNRYGLSVVLEDAQEHLSYWSLQHTSTSPDFHVVDDFLIAD